MVFKLNMEESNTHAQEMLEYINVLKV